MKSRLFTTTALLALVLPAAAFAQTATTATTPPATAVAPDPGATTAPAAPEEIIVTGTRQLGRTKADSPAPVDVISGAALQQTGEQNVFDALNKVLPSLEPRRCPRPD
jgi:iron complex outermembrane receptor protein